MADAKNRVRTDRGDILLFSQGLGQGLGAAVAVDGRRDDAAGISGAFAAGVQAGDLDVAEGVFIPRDADG